MAKGYWLVRVDIRDMDEYMRHVAANAAPNQKVRREPVSTADVVIIEGYDGPQPV